MITIAIDDLTRYLRTDQRGTLPVTSLRAISYQDYMMGLLQDLFLSVISCSNMVPMVPG